MTTTSDELLSNAKRTNVAWLYPGQGSQHAGMHQVWMQHEMGRAVFEEASHVLGYDLSDLCSDASDARINQTEFSQPALLATSVSASRVLGATCDISPCIAAGHSLGELSALVAADALSLADGIRLARTRGQLMQSAAPEGTGRMAAIFGLSSDIVTEICSRESGPEVAALANINAAEQCVVSGHTGAIDRVCKKAEDAGGVAHVLPISIPAHSLLMKPAAEGFAAALQDVELREPKWPVLTNATATPHEADTIRESLVAQLTSPVCWVDIMQRIQGPSLSLTVELGPKTVRRDLFKLEHPGTLSFATSTKSNFETLCSFLAKQDDSAGTGEFLRDRFVATCLRIAVSTPNACGDRDRYASGVVKSYRTLETLRERERETGNASGDAEIRDAANLLRRILKTKRLDAEARAARLGSLISETRAQEILVDFDIS